MDPRARLVLFLGTRKSVAPTGIQALDRSARSTVVPATLRPEVRFEIPTVKNSSCSTVKTIKANVFADRPSACMMRMISV